MVEITQPKLASLAPSWAPFAGTTTILPPLGDIPADGARAAASSALAFHATLGDLLAERRQPFWRTEFGLCCLPRASYHLTFADLVHDGNMAHLPDGIRAALQAGGGPGGNAATALLRPLVARAGLPDVDAAPLALRFAGLDTMAGRIVAARLAPAPDARAQAAYDSLVAARERLAAALLDELEIVLKPWAPHVTLGYFANADGAVAAADDVRALDADCHAALAGRSIRYAAPAMFTFTDMARYTQVEPAA